MQHDKFLPWAHQHGLVVTEAEADAIAKRWATGAPATEEPQEAVTTGARKGGKGASGKGKDSLDDVSTTDAASEGSQRPSALATVPRCSAPLTGSWGPYNRGPGILGALDNGQGVSRMILEFASRAPPDDNAWDKGKGKGQPRPPAVADATQPWGGEEWRQNRNSWSGKGGGWRY